MPSILHRLADWAQTAPTAPAQRYKVNGEWRTISAREFRDRVFHLALYLESQGIGPGHAGAVFAYNSPEWVHVDLATLLTGARSAGLYPNSTAKDIHYILDHSEARVLAVQNRDYFQRITGKDGSLPLPDRIQRVIVFDGDTSIHPRAIAYEAALAEGRRLASERRDSTEMARLLGRIDARSGAILIYTSGTTGNPKGALLSHDNLIYTSDIVARYWKLPMGRGTLFSFLPLCHIAEKLQSIGVGISQRYTVSYCTRFENVSSELAEVQPTLLLCVPRLWEKMMEGVLYKVRSGRGAKKKLAEWALEVGERVAHARYSGGRASLPDLVQLRLADKLVLSKIRQALGLGQAELLASGAAALNPGVARWFRSLGLEILEDYGQTETTGVVCMTEPGVESAGTVGRPLPGTDFKLAEDGEILTRGRHVFVGYSKDEAATAATLVDGWCHTGDLGVVNERGLVEIRGRKKEVLKTSGGKMVAPLPIEERIKESGRVGQVCIVGDGRKYLGALVTLSEEKLADFSHRAGSKLGETITDAGILEDIRSVIDSVNRGLAGFEQIKRFAVLGRDFSIEAGEMTPTLKMKRAVIERNFKSLIDSLYSGGGD